MISVVKAYYHHQSDKSSFNSSCLVGPECCSVSFPRLLEHRNEVVNYDDRFSNFGTL